MQGGLKQQLTIQRLHESRTTDTGTAGMYAVKHDNFFQLQQQALELSVIVPVFNEADNVELLVSRLTLALADIEWEVIFVDDGSTDFTQRKVEVMAQCDRRIRILQRVGRRGLSSAVVEGFLSSSSPVVAVIDGDLQHDETILPGLYHAILTGNADIAIGTRYAAGGSVGDWADNRARISRFATLLAGLVMKTTVSDPMSGFFAVRRDIAVECAPRLSSVGYKLLLDILASMPRQLKVAEIPYHFRNRLAGYSKLDNAVALEYLELLADKIVGRFVPVKLIMFGTIGVIGTAVHLAILALCLNVLGTGFSTAQTVATACAMTFNFALNNELTYRDRKLSGKNWFKGWVSFCAACSLGALANVGIGSMLYSDAWSWWVAGIAGAAVGSVWNYAATSWLTWKKK